jgi:hypothetical protein
MNNALYIILVISQVLSLSIFAQDGNRFGWIADKGGIRDKNAAGIRKFSTAVIRPFSDLEKKMPPIYDQGYVGSCTANGAAAAFDYRRGIDGKPFITPSRLFIYYNTRAYEGTIKEDAGAQIRNAVGMTIEYGSPREILWPYRESKFKVKPTAVSYKEALNYQSLSAYKVSNTNGLDIRKSLSLNPPLPVIFGSFVYSGINQIDHFNNVLKMPKKGESPQGGHCMVIIGHDDAKRLYKVRNSWGKKWGTNGNFFIPYDYIHSARITSDCWVIDKAE